MLRILYASYSSSAQFLDSILLEEDKTLLGVTTKASYQDGEEAILEIGFPKLPNRILLRATATQAPDGGDGLAWFVIDETDELQLDFLIAVASGRANASIKRRHRRFPLRMGAQVKVDGGEGEPLRAQTADMATSGVALETDEPLPDGTRVSVVLDPGDGSEELVIAGTVRWHRASDSENAEVGIEFENDGSADMKRLRQLIRGVKLSGEVHGKA